MTKPKKKLIAETPNYAVRIETVKSNITTDGLDQVYAIYNKETKVVEARGANLPEALSYMKGLQIAYDRITQGEPQATPAGTDGHV